MTDDLKARLDALHVWPQAVADAYAAELTPRQIDKLYAVGKVATEAADRIATLEAALINMTQQRDAVMVGAVKVRAAELVRFYPQTMLMLPEQERVCEYLAELIPRALDPDASAALAEYVRPLQDEVTRLREGLAEIAAMPDYRLPKAQDRARALLEGAKP